MQSISAEVERRAQVLDLFTGKSMVCSYGDYTEQFTAIVAIGASDDELAQWISRKSGALARFLCGISPCRDTRLREMGRQAH